MVGAENHWTSASGAYGLAVMPVVHSARRGSCGEMDHLRNLGHALVDARQSVGLIVDDNKNLQVVQTQHVIGKRVLAHLHNPFPIDVFRHRP